MQSGKRVFIKDITHYLLPPDGQTARIAPSLARLERGVGTEETANVVEKCDKDSVKSDGDSGIVVSDDASVEERQSPPFPYESTQQEAGNPTVIPKEILEKFHFTFLIRHPRASIPSYYRCCVPPLVEKTGFAEFMPSESGYDELRRFFDFCKDSGLTGPKICGRESGEVVKPGSVEICVIDADDLLDNPEGILRKYCESIGLDFSPAMLNWDNEEDHRFAKEAFEKWNGFHEDAIESRDLKPRTHVSCERDCPPTCFPLEREKKSLC